MLKAYKKKRPKNRIDLKNNLRKKLRTVELDDKEREQEILDYKKGK